jgi:hypothetical protein
VSVKDDLLDDLPQICPGLTRPEVERLLTLLDKGASTEGNLSLSIATAIKPLAPEVAARIESYGQSRDADEYLRMLRGAAVLLLQQWRPEQQPPTPESVEQAVANIEADA